MNLFFYPDDSEILETWISISSFKYFQVIRIKKQICSFIIFGEVTARQFCFEIYWPLVRVIPGGFLEFASCCLVSQGLWNSQNCLCAPILIMAVSICCSLHKTTYSRTDPILYVKKFGILKLWPHPSKVDFRHPYSSITLSLSSLLPRLRTLLYKGWLANIYLAM